MFEQYQTPQYAGFWLRFAASLIDGLLLMVVFCPLMMVFGVFGAIAEEAGGGAEAMQAASAGISLLLQIVMAIAGWLYEALLTSSSWQGTVGKRVLGIRVTDMDGNRISFGRATGRYFAKHISNMICLIGYIMAAFTERKQALHDLIASTLVLQGAGTGTAGVTLNQPPPPPPSDYGQGGYGGGGYGGGGYGGGQGGYGQGGYGQQGGGYNQGGYNQGGGGYGQGS